MPHVRDLSLTCLVESQIPSHQIGPALFDSTTPVLDVEDYSLGVLFTQAIRCGQLLTPRNQKLLDDTLEGIRRRKRLSCH